MKTWVENRPGRPGGSDFSTSDLEIYELPEGTEDDARALVTRLAKDEEDATMLLDVLGL